MTFSQMCGHNIIISDIIIILSTTSSTSTATHHYLPNPHTCSQIIPTKKMYKKLTDNEEWMDHVYIVNKVVVRAAEWGRENDSF